MPHTGRNAANRRVARYRTKIAQLRKQANGATKEMRAELPERATMFERIVEATERDSQEPEHYGPSNHD
jgi:hypothetical protein